MHELLYCVDEASYKKAKAKYDKLPGAVLSSVKFGADAPLLAGYLNATGGVGGPPVIQMGKRYAKEGVAVRLVHPKANVGFSVGKAGSDEEKDLAAEEGRTVGQR